MHQLYTLATERIASCADYRFLVILAAFLARRTFPGRVLMFEAQENVARSTLDATLEQQQEPMAEQQDGAKKVADV